MAEPGKTGRTRILYIVVSIVLFAGAIAVTFFITTRQFRYAAGAMPDNPWYFLSHAAGIHIYSDDFNIAPAYEAGVEPEPAGLKIPLEELKNQGKIDQLWWLDNHRVLLKQVWRQDQDYYLFDRSTGRMDWIVPAIESARLVKIVKEKLVFLAKGGDDCGNYQFPYRLTYDPDENKTAREDIYLRRDVVFGSAHSWKNILKGIDTGENQVAINFRVAEGQVLAGGLRQPLTIAVYNGNRLTVRIFNVVCSPFSKNVDNRSSIVTRITCRALPEGFPVDNPDLLKEKFPYGGEFPDGMVLKGPSALVEIELKEKASYNVSFNSDAGSNSSAYRINLMPGSRGDEPGGPGGLTDDQLRGLNPAEVMELYWQARQHRNVEALGVLLAEGTGLAGVGEVVAEAKREWDQGYWMVIGYSVGDYTINGGHAIVKVSMKTTDHEGRLIEHEKVPYRMTRQNGVWKVDILAAQ